MQILTAMVDATDLPVDAKIRLLPLPPKGADTPNAASSSLATPAATPPLAAAEAAHTTPSAVLEPTIPPTLTVPSETASLSASPKTDAASEQAEAKTPVIFEDDEPTHALVERIFATEIANLTVHCRTQEMRSREPALHERMRGVTKMGHERGIPVVCNGDAVGGGKEAGWGNFDEVCEKTGTFSAVARLCASELCSAVWLRVD